MIVNCQVWRPAPGKNMWANHVVDFARRISYEYGSDFACIVQAYSQQDLRSLQVKLEVQKSKELNSPTYRAISILCLPCRPSYRVATLVKFKRHSINWNKSGQLDGKKQIVLVKTGCLLRHQQKLEKYGKGSLSSF